jgi:ubiquinone/menaquinone biosynthesis C-methylase UbiE
VEGTEYLKNWSVKEKVIIDVKVADMLNLPYEDNSFDAIFAYHVISHTDTKGMMQILDEISRVLKRNCEIFISLCSKETWSFKDAGYPKIDENTVVKTEEGAEKGISHFYVTLDDIIGMLKDFQIERIRHTDDCYFGGRRQNSKYYFVMARLRSD